MRVWAVLRELHTTAILALVAEIVDERDRELRAALIGAHLMGLLLSRYMFKTEAMAKADLDAAATPVIDQYLSGALTPGAGHSPRREGNAAE